MSNPNLIEEGDIVDVHFENVQSLFNVEVLGKPSDIGDSWRLKQTGEGHVPTLYYVQQFSLMKLVKKGE